MSNGPSSNSHSRAPRPVRCVETGRVYESAAAAGRAFGVAPGVIGTAVRKGYRIRGHFCQYVDDPSSPSPEAARIQPTPEETPTRPPPTPAKKAETLPAARAASPTPAVSNGNGGASPTPAHLMGVLVAAMTRGGAAVDADSCALAFRWVEEQAAGLALVHRLLHDPTAAVVLDGGRPRLAEGTR